MKGELFPYATEQDDSFEGISGIPSIDIVKVDGAVMAHIDCSDERVVSELCQPHRINALMVICCMKGQVSFSSHASMHHIHAGQVFLSTASVIKFNEVKDSELYLLVFRSSFMTSMNVDVRFTAHLLSTLRSADHIFDVNPEKSVDIYQFFAMLKQEYKLAEKSEFLIASLRHLFCSMIFRIYDALNCGDGRVLPALGVKDRSAEYFERLMQLLGENYRTQRSVEFYADKMNISPKHLTRVIRNFTGKSVHQWIDEFVALEIKNMLKYSDRSIQQISYELNFPNPSFMGQYFKRITGMTPGEYKRK